MLRSLPVGIVLAEPSSGSCIRMCCVGLSAFLFANIDARFMSSMSSSSVGPRTFDRVLYVLIVFNNFISFFGSPLYAVLNIPKCSLLLSSRALSITACIVQAVIPGLKMSAKLNYTD